MPARKELDEAIITRLAERGVTVTEIAAICNVNRSTIQENYSGAIKRGQECRNGRLREAQYIVAVEKHNAAMLIWLGKQYLGQREPTHLTDDDYDAILTEARELFAAEGQEPTERTGRPTSKHGADTAL